MVRELATYFYGAAICFHYFNSMYAINEFSKTPIFQINQHIGNDKDKFDENGILLEEGDGQGIDGIQFANEVLSFNENQNIDKLLFYINSQGGDVQKSLDMFNSIAMSNKKTHSIITGFAFSCAGWIPLAADRVDMVEETGRWMCHMPYNPEDPEEKSEFMDEVVDIISKTISSKSGRNGKPKKTQEEIKKLMKVKTYWDAQMMYDEGLIDNKVNASGKVIRYEKDPITLNKTELSFYYKENQVALNKFIAEEIKEEKKEEVKIISNDKTINKMAFPKVVNRLNSMDSKALGFKINLTEDSSEDVIIDTIVRLENRLRAMNDDMMDMDNKVKSKDSESKIALDAAKKLAEDKEKEAKDSMASYNSMKEKFDNMEVENKSMKDEKDAMNKEKVALDLKFRQERANNFVEKLIEQKKVVATDEMTIDKVKEYLVNKATDHYEDVVTQYAIQPIKMSGAKPRLSNGVKVDLNLIDKLVADNRERISKKQYVIENGVKRMLHDNSIATN